MKNVAQLVAAALLLLAIPAVGCEEPVACDKCEKNSEFSWNPSDQYATVRLQRFYGLEDLMEAAYKNKRYEEAKTLIAEYLALAKIYRCNWNYGNAVHDAHRILGLILLQGGDVDGAAAALLEAGQSAGSPQLDTFGPDLDLANELLKRGKTPEVTAYLNDIKRFWEMDNGVVDQWLTGIAAGAAPELNKHRASEHCHDRAN